MAERRRWPRGLRAGLGLLAVLAGIAVTAPVWSDDPGSLDLPAALSAPGPGHWMGTDDLGRDVLARVAHGARVSLRVGLLTTGFALLVGLPLGAIAGYRGGWADAAVSRLVEALLTVPTLLLALAVISAGQGWLARLDDVTRVALVLGGTGWMPVARYLRAEFLRLERSEMVASVRALGAGHARIVLRHILPSALTPVLVTAAFTVGGAIAAEAALSFLDLGIRPPTPSWGGMLFEAREQVDRAWWLALFPGLALFLSILACNLTGEGVRDLLDPRTRVRR